MEIRYMDGKFVTDTGEGLYEVDNVVVHAYSVDRLIEYLKAAPPSHERLIKCLDDVYSWISIILNDKKDPIPPEVTISEMSRLMDAMIENTHNPEVIKYATTFICQEYMQQITQRHDSDCAFAFFTLMRDEAFKLILKDRRLDTLGFFFMAHGFYRYFGIEQPWKWTLKNFLTCYTLSHIRGAQLSTYNTTRLIDLYLNDQMDGTNYLNAWEFTNWDSFDGNCIMELTEIPAYIAEIIMKEEEKGKLSIPGYQKDIYEDTITIHKILCLELSHALCCDKVPEEKLRMILRDPGERFGEAYRGAFEMGFYAACYQAAVLLRDGMARRRIVKAVNVREIKEAGTGRTFTTYTATSDREFEKRRALTFLSVAAGVILLCLGVHVAFKLQAFYIKYGIDGFFAIAGFAIWGYFEYLQTPQYAVKHGGHVGYSSSGSYFVWF